jgi:tRNA pseudouridine synthase 10
MSKIEIKDFICERCYYLITNYTNDESSLDKKKIFDLKCSSNCNFCFGILDFDSYKDLINEIKLKIIEYTHKDYRLSVNFSLILELIHYYWRCIIQKDNNLKIKNINELEPNMLRVIFKQLFIQSLSRDIHESFNPKGDLEIIINFEFPQNIYDEINNMFKFMKKNITFLPGESAKTNINYRNIINKLQKGMIIAVFDKFKLNSIANKQENILQKNIEFLKESLYLNGTYNKFTREIGQTKWEINGIRVCSSSVEEEMKNTLIPLYDCKDCIMSAGGREDRDVRMLGKGRPFIIEIINPKKEIFDMNEIINKINNNSKFIQVNNLESCNRDYIDNIKNAELNKMKLYTSVVYVEKEINDDDIKKINEVKNMKIIQKTPFRVLHRRTLMDRDKIIFILEAKKINEHFLILDVLASAGTYIKEFVHSDLGRTNPSIKSILNSNCDILQLDVRDLVYVNNKDNK